MGLLQGVLDYETHREALDRLVALYRPELPAMTTEGVAAIEKAIPEYVRPHDPRYAEVMRLSMDIALGHWFDMVADPAVDSRETLAFFREIGVGEAREGRSMEAWQSAARVGTRAAIDHITRRNAERGFELPGTVVGQITTSVLTYIDFLAEAVAAGHAEAGAREVGEFQGRRRRMLELLLEGGERALKEVRELAVKTGWTVPQTVAVVALHERDGGPARRPALPSEVLVGLHLAEPCLVVPDPDGPGRRRMLEHGLGEWYAAAGPPVPPAEAARSREWARRALDLVRRGLLPGEGVLVADEHVPSLAIVPHADLVGRVAARRLGPLLHLRPRQRRVLAETLLACLESGFNATEVAQRLHMHAQTIRYRVRQLEGLLGESIYDPAGRLELHLALHGWLALNPPGADELAAVPDGPLDGRTAVHHHVEPGGGGPRGGRLVDDVQGQPHRLGARRDRLVDDGARLRRPAVHADDVDRLGHLGEAPVDGLTEHRRRRRVHGDDALAAPLEQPGLAVDRPLGVVVEAHEGPCPGVPQETADGGEVRVRGVGVRGAHVRPNPARRPVISAVRRPLSVTERGRRPGGARGARRAPAGAVRTAGPAAARTGPTGRRWAARPRCRRAATSGARRRSAARSR